MIMKKVKLISSEGESLEVDEDVAIKSELIKKIIEDTTNEDPIPLPNVKINILKKVMEYCEKHKNNTPSEIEKPVKSIDMLENVSDPWDAKYIEIENSEDLFELILAANYLDIKSLIDLSCAKIATMIKGKSPEEVSNIFNIQNYFTDEEEALRMENKWA